MESRHHTISIHQFEKVSGVQEPELVQKVVELIMQGPSPTVLAKTCIAYTHEQWFRWAIMHPENDLVHPTQRMWFKLVIVSD